MKLGEHGHADAILRSAKKICKQIFKDEYKVAHASSND